MGTRRLRQCAKCILVQRSLNKFTVSESLGSCLAPYAGRVENGTGPAHRGLLGADQPGPGAVPMEVWD